MPSKKSTLRQLLPYSRVGRGLRDESDASSMRYAGLTLHLSLEEQNLSDVEVELVTRGIWYKWLGPHLLRKLLSVYRQFMSLKMHEVVKSWDGDRPVLTLLRQRREGTFFQTYLGCLFQSLQTARARY